MAWLLDDLTAAAKSLLRDPRLPLAAAGSLALGIGVNTSVFTLINAVLLRELPVAEAQRLVMLHTPRAEQIGSAHGGAQDIYSYPMFQDLRTAGSGAVALACRFATEFHLSHERTTAVAAGELVSGDYFAVLGVPASVGRLLRADDERPGAAGVVVLEHTYWQERFGGDPGVVGSRILLDGEPLTVVGVAGPRFRGFAPAVPAKVWAPVTQSERVLRQGRVLQARRHVWLHVLGRLGEGVTAAQAQARLDAAFRAALAAEAESLPPVTPQRRERFLAQALRLDSGARGWIWWRENAGRMLVWLMGAVGLVLLIACANAALLLLARGEARRRETAVRLALGAGRWRLARQQFFEGLFLALAAGAAGLLLSMWLTQGLTALAPAQAAGLAPEMTPDGRVIAFTLALSVVASLLFSFTPALEGARTAPARMLHADGPEAGGRNRLGMRDGLVVVQVCLSFVLLLGALLFVEDLRRLHRAELGITADRLVLVALDPSRSGFSGSQTAAFYGALLERARGLPMVRSASLATSGLITGPGWQATVRVEGYQESDGEDITVGFLAASPDHFRTVGIPLVRGRHFQESDVGSRHKVAIVSEAFARYFFRGGDAVSRRLTTGGSGAPLDTEIIGVARDGRYGDLRGKPPRLVYVPDYQEHGTGVVLYLRAAGPVTPLMEQARRLVRELAPGLPVEKVQSLEGLLEETLADSKALAVLAGLFSMLATALAGLGLHGLLSHLVVRRTREIGLRMALGAARGEVLLLVLRRQGALLAVGLALGFAGFLALAGGLAAMLEEIRPLEPVIQVVAAAVLAAVSLAASLGPALWATRVDPASALRHE